MRQDTSDRLDATFLALADPTRRAILARLSLGDASVTELGEPFAISQPAISKHLKILERANLISVGQGRAAPSEAAGWQAACRGDRLARAVSGRRETNFQRLDGLLDEMQRASRRPARGGQRTKRSKRG